MKREEKSDNPTGEKRNKLTEELIIKIATLHKTNEIKAQQFQILGQYGLLWERSPHHTFTQILLKLGMDKIDNLKDIFAMTDSEINTKLQEALEKKDTEAEEMLEHLSKMKGDFSSLKKGSPEDLKTDEFEMLRRKNGLPPKKVLPEDKNAHRNRDKFSSETINKITNTLKKKTEEDEIEKIPVRGRTEEEHNKLISKYGGFCAYLRSMGKFKDVAIEEGE